MSSRTVDAKPRKRGCAPGKEREQVIVETHSESIFLRASLLITSEARRSQLVVVLGRFERGWRALEGSIY